MLRVGYLTPYKCILLLLIQMLIKYDYPRHLGLRIVKFITSSILNEEKCKEECSEPSFTEVLEQIKNFCTFEEEYLLMDLKNELETMDNPHNIDSFIKDFKHVFNMTCISEFKITISKSSILGIFIRQSLLDYTGRSSLQLAEDIQKALRDYIQHKPASWISDHNTKLFLNHQAERLETTGQCCFDPKALHKFLEDVQKELPNLLATIEHVRYLNYLRTREYSQALFHLHNSFDISLTEGVEMQYALLNLGILEYKFGHISSAIPALNEALTVARLNNDDYCLQEVQYWIEVCNNQNKNDLSFIEKEADKYIYNLTQLSHVRQKLKNGGDFQDIIDSLNQTLSRIIENDIEYMNRSQFLTTCLAWKKYGSSILAETYLKLTKKMGEDSVEDIEKTILTEAAMLESSGDSQKALAIIDNFINKYPNESDFLVDWKQARAHLIHLIQNKKREFDRLMLTENNVEKNIIELDEPFISSSIKTEDCFKWYHDKAYYLILENELSQALELLIYLKNQIRETNNNYLGTNLILQATVHIAKQVPEEAIPYLREAMEISKDTFDTQTYYKATITLAYVYVFSAPDKSLWMLEHIFPKVLSMKSKALTLELYYLYAVVLDKVSSLSEFTFKAGKETILDYIEKAEQGYRELSLNNELLRTLMFKWSIIEKFKLFHKRQDILEEINQLHLSQRAIHM
ncbi:anaphase-promoting complex subunit 5-domain-containing protein [Cokeromyces recurvatus]|uniref:anaphase-promoting complex subunit 5-domain-containing protein n=1 Tax=Cokeromyces recurvatus TaxID=90255 RepID=UPI002220C3FC|nr:anaphase-promoting complex subunit 5-domain-containing protein [Cokeromyces recurvatus]KAI7903687.1 anaphase-promoting complex subunit 5-domain-containing protein [Cokeromyces recurvatus]